MPKIVKKIRRLHWIWIGIFIVCGYSSQLIAGATIYYHPTEGTPLRWETDEDGKAEIHYTVDVGGLGRLTHGQALQLLQTAMDIWESVANVEFIFDGTTDVDVDETNYQSYTVTSTCADDSPSSSIENAIQLNRMSLIVFDNSADSTIIDNMDGIAGTGNSYGVTDITCINGTDEDPESIASAQIIFNGTTIDGTNNNFDDLTVNAFLGIMLHELGHFLGLDHSDVNGVLLKLFNEGSIGEEYLEFLPTMARLDPNDGYGEFMDTLHPDDIAAVQVLYPFDDSPDSILTGTITNSNNSDFRGAQLELRKLDDPLCEVISFISGKQCTPLYFGFGVSITFIGSQCGKSTDPSDDNGDFFLRAVPPGRYALSVQEIIDDYKSGAIRPWGSDDPLPELVGVAEFYNGGDNSADDPLTMSTVTVVDGEDIDGLNIVLSASSADGDGEENLLALSVFSESPFTDSLTVAASSRCQANTVDYAALIGVEELVGNTDGEEEEEETDSSSSSGCSLVNIL